MKDEQARKLTTPKARHGHDAIPGAQVWHESACMVGKEKQETNQLKYTMTNLQKAIESIKLHQEPGHLPSNDLVLATANKFGVEPDLIMLPFIDEDNARPIKSLTIGEMAEKQGKDGKRARRFLRSGLDTKLDYNEQVQNQAIGKEGVQA